MERFGSKLRTLRERQGMTQDDLAAMLGFSREHVSRLERGVKIPHAKLLIRIADIFGVTVDVLIRDERDLDAG